MNLSDLIYHYKGNLTWDELAERMPGGSPGKKALQRMAIKTIPESPTPETIRNLAQAFGIQESVIWAAIGESLGLTITREESALMALMPSGTAALTAEQVGAILSMIRSMIETNRNAARLEEIAEAAEAKAKSAGQPGPELGRRPGPRTSRRPA